MSPGWGAIGCGPPGRLIDQAGSLVAASRAAGVGIDEVTAGLIGARFEVRREGEELALVRRRADTEVPRTLLGKATTFVGREKELALLVATARESAAESIARAVVVSGPAGQGKSRMAHELLARLADDPADRRVLCPRGDPPTPRSAPAPAPPPV